MPWPGSLLPGGEAIAAELMAPVHAYLADYPEDYVGAQEIVLSMIVGYAVTSDDPASEAARANAEPMIRDDPYVTLRRFAPEEVARLPLTVALGREPLAVIEAAADQIARWTGSAPLRVDAEHEVYLFDPSVLTGIVVSLCLEPEYARSEGQ